MQLKKYFRKNIYRWHRITGMLIALPVMLWTLSGFLHPVMNSTKPEVRNQSLPEDTIDAKKIKIGLQQALLQNGIAQLHQFRIIKLDSNYFYQIQQTGTDSLTYVDCNEGHVLQQGDKRYAAYLAQRFLSEPTEKKQTDAHQHGLHADIADVATPVFASKFPYPKTAIRNIVLVKKFTPEYKSSNVLLPVYQVSFDRPDHIRLYIETSTGRLATAIDDKKAWFTIFFSIAHSWSFLDAWGKTKNILLAGFSFLCFLSSLFGFYIYNIIRRPKKNASASNTRSWHRTLGNIFVVTTLLYSFSGAWHSFHKVSNKDFNQASALQFQFCSEELDLPLASIVSSLTKKETLTGVSIIRMENKNYWQLELKRGKEKTKKYLDTKNLQELADGDTKYGCYLACAFANKTHHSITHTACITEFNHQYSMMNKRLPVIEVGFDASENYYVETTTGYLSAITSSSDKAERFSFSNLHMHHYWEMWLGKGTGKTVRNTVLLTSTSGLLLLALTGCMMYYRKKKKRGADRGFAAG